MRALVVALVPFVVAACSSSARTEDTAPPAPIPECEAMATKLAGCFGTSASAPAMAERTAAMRASFAAAAGKLEERERMRERCEASLRQLEGVCR